MKCLLAANAILLVACTHSLSKSSAPANAPVIQPYVQAPSDRRGYSVNSDDFHGVYFKEGQPKQEATLLSALSTKLGDSKAALKHDLELMSTFSDGTQFMVVGFTDNHECQASQCAQLSLRRAQLVHAWLIENGFPSDRLSAPYGFGSSRPIGDNDNEAGRAKNRRAHISYGSELDNLKKKSATEGRQASIENCRIVCEHGPD